MLSSSSYGASVLFDLVSKTVRQTIDRRRRLCIQTPEASLNPKDPILSLIPGAGETVP
jgi:hypothetical protein